MFQVTKHDIDRLMAVLDNAPTVHIYHHFCYHPWKIENSQGNHYMYFSPSDQGLFPYVYKGVRNHDIVVVGMNAGNDDVTTSTTLNDAKTTSTTANDVSVGHVKIKCDCSNKDEKIAPSENESAPPAYWTIFLFAKMLCDDKVLEAPLF